MATDDPGLNSNGLTADEQATFEGLYGPDAGAAQTEPKPGTFAGWWHAAGAVPHALANVGLDVYGATNAALGNAVHGVTQKIEDWHNDDFNALAGQPEGAGMGTPFKAAPDYLPQELREKADAAETETSQQIADLRSTVDQDYRPDPHTTGKAGNLLFGAIDPLVRIGVGTLLTRGAGGLEFAAGTQGYERTQELEAQGVDPGTAAASGAVSAGTFEAMGAVGGEGESLALRVLKSGAVNFAGGIANRGADSAILKAAGYNDLAAQEQWNDAQTMISDALIGLAFPLVHEGINRTLDAAATRSETKLADKITANPELFDKLHDGTGYVPAANVDAAMTSLNARNAADVAPGIPTDFRSQGLHYKALDAAIKQVANGDDVYVDPIVRGMNTIPRPVPEGKADGFAEALASDAEADPFRYAERDENGAITGYRSGENFIPAFANLTDAQREVEARAAAQVLDDPEAAIAAYANIRNAKGEQTTDAGNLINTDEARELFPDYNAGPEARSMNALAVHEPSSWVAKQAWERALGRAPREGKDNTVFFTGGGTGAGKSTGPKRIPDLAAKQDNADIIFDGNLNGFGSATKKIDAALASKRKVHILYTFRDPVQAFIHGAVPRAERADYGRTVPIPVHVDTHVGAAETYLRLKEHYKDNPNVTIEAIHNDFEPGVRSEVTSDYPDERVAIHAAADRGKLTSEVRDAFERERQAGRVSDRVYHGTLGIPGRATSGGAGSLSRMAEGQSERDSGRVQRGETGVSRDRESRDGRVESVDGQAEGVQALRPEAGRVRPEGHSGNDLNPAAGGVSASGPGEPLHPWTPVDDTVSVPYAGGVSDDGQTVYLDKRMPETVEVDGKTIDAKAAVVLHERTEWPLMHLTGPMDAKAIDALLARAGGEGEVPEKVLDKLRVGEPLTYPEAHHIATLTENHWVRETYGVDPEQYQHALTDAIAKARKEAPHEKDIPTDLDAKPYDNIGEPLLANKGAEGVESGTPSSESTRGADAKATAGTAGEAGTTGPAEPNRGEPDQEGRAGTGAPAAGDRDVARAREAVTRRPDLMLPEGITAAEAMRQADEDVAEAHRQGAGIEAAIRCFLSFGSDIA